MSQGQRWQKRHLTALPVRHSPLLTLRVSKTYPSEQSGTSLSLRRAWRLQTTPFASSGTCHPKCEQTNSVLKLIRRRTQFKDRSTRRRMSQPLSGTVEATPRTRIAVSALNAYPAIQPSAARNVGGLENFAWTFCQAMAATDDLAVSLLLRHSKPIPEDSMLGVEFVKLIEPLREVRLQASRCVRRRATFPFLTIERWKWSLLWQIPLLGAVRAFCLRVPHDQQLERLLKQAVPQLAVSLGVNADSMATIQAARRLKIPNALWFRSNGDLDTRFFQDANFIDPYAVTSAAAQYCIENADILIAQSQWQADRLKQLTGRDCYLIRNPIDLKRFPLPNLPFEQRHEVLWIGRMDRHHKRPLLAIEIARRCPHIPFRLIANRSDSEVEAEVLRSLPSNVTLMDYVPRTEIPNYYRQARVFLSTGAVEHEGFPNVFLESAASGTPIVSLDDFDDFLKRSGSGIATVGDLSLAAEAISELCQSSKSWCDYSQRGRTFVEQHHSTTACVEQFRALLLDRRINNCPSDVA